MVISNDPAVIAGEIPVGVYLYRTTELPVLGYRCYVYDLRVCKAYWDKPMTPQVMHTIEHIGGELFRKCFGNSFVHFGPEGDQTGFVLVITSRLDAQDLRNYVISVFKQIAKWNQPIPGTLRYQCGQAFLQNIGGAKEVSARYVRVLSNQTGDILDYPIAVPYPAPPAVPEPVGGVEAPSGQEVPATPGDPS